jgi:hypothetical protein
MLSKPHSLIGRRDFLLTSALTAGAIGALLPSSAAHAGGGGGNWDVQQHLTAGRVEWPTGPLFLAGGETPKWVEAWVVQDSTGASQRTVQNPPFTSTTQWLANTFGWKQGTFSFGLALGIALVATEKGSTSLFTWWASPIVLVP